MGMAMERCSMWPRTARRSSFLHPPSLEEIHPYVTESARETYAGIVDTEPEHGRVLTDDF